MPKYQIVAETESDFLRQVSEQITKNKSRDGESKFFIHAATATDFLNFVSEQLPKITFRSIIEENVEDCPCIVCEIKSCLEETQGKKCENRSKYVEKALQHISIFNETATNLACNLFVSMVVTEWDREEEYDESTFPLKLVRKLARWKYAKNIHDIKKQFRKFNNWERCSGYSKEVKKLLERFAEFDNYQDVKQFYGRNLQIFVDNNYDDAAKVLLDMALYNFRDKEDEEFLARLDEIDRESGRRNYFMSITEMEGLNEIPFNILSILIEGQFRDIKKIIINRQGCLVFLPKRKKGIVLYEGEDYPVSDWVDFESENIDLAIELLRESN